MVVFLYVRLFEILAPESRRLISASGPWKGRVLVVLMRGLPRRERVGWFGAP